MNTELAASNPLDHVKGGEFEFNLALIPSQTFVVAKTNKSMFMCRTSPHIDSNRSSTLLFISSKNFNEVFVCTRVSVHAQLPSGKDTDRFDPTVSYQSMEEPTPPCWLCITQTKLWRVTAAAADSQPQAQRCG